LKKTRVVGIAAVMVVALLFAARLPADTPPPVAIVEGVSLDFADVANPDVDIPLTFVERNGKPTVVTLAAFPCVSANGSVSSLIANAEKAASSVTLPLAPNGTAPVRFSAFLPNAGKYRCVVRAVATIGKTRTPLADFIISIARTRSRPSVDVAAIPAIPKEIGWTDDRVTASFSVSVYATGGDLTLPPPHLVNATWKQKTDSSAGTATTLKLEGASGDMKVTTARPRTLSLSLADITTPGKYEATLRFAKSGYEPIDATVTVFVREPWFHAFLILALGVLLSFLVHVYGSTIRPRLISEQRVIWWRQQLNAARAKAQGDPDEEELVAGVEGRIRRKWEVARIKRVAIGDTIDVYDRIVEVLPQWVALHRQLLGVKPAEVRDTLMPKLTKARDEFLKDTPDATTLQTAIDTLDTMPETIRAEIRKTLDDTLKKFDARLAPDSRQSVTEIRILLQVVRLKMQAGQIEVAVGSFEAARLRYVAIFSDDLRGRIAASAAPPRGLLPEEWEKLKADTIGDLDDIAKLSDPDAAMDLLVGATARYLHTFGAALRRSVEKLDAAVRENVEALVKEVNTEIATGELTVAWQKLDAAQKIVRDAIVRTTGMSMGLEALSAAAAMPATGFDPVLAFDLPSSWSSLGRRSAAAVTARTITGIDFLISFLVLVVAGAIGVQTMWVDNPTWGGGVAYLATFLWGFAADQFTHAGVAALMKKS
jgi:hypothetical protein